jgi:hypothetical protein
MPRSKKQQSDQGARVLEQGDIYFLYRPKVSEKDPGVSGEEDIQRLYLVLKPQGKRRRYRLIVVPRKQLPDTRKGQEKFWGFVDKVSTRSTEMGDELGGKEYQTRTRGKRVQPEAYPAGEGVYAIAQHGDHTHLAYVLELPDLPGDVQKALNITEEASYIISVKNPEQPAPEGLGLGQARRAGFPKKLQERFRGRRFIQVVPPEFLNHEGAELLLIGSAGDTFEELGIELKDEDESESTAEIFRDLRLEKSQRMTDPLLEGKWA